MNLPRNMFVLAALLLSLPWIFAQSSGDQIGAITAALRAREFNKAIQLLQPALRQSPKSAQLWTLQGIALSGEEHEKEALTSFHNTLKISPQYLPAMEGAAQLEYKAGSDEAIPLLQQLLRLQPSDPTSHAMLAVLFCKRGDCAAAVQHFERSGSLPDSQPDALRQYGACLVKLKQLAKAISVFGRLVNLDSAHGDARNYLATVQLLAEHPKDAIETLGPILQRGDANVRTLQLAASAYEISAVLLSMYGGGFATVPAYLRDLFGTHHVSAIHGRVLTAWSVAGVLGPVLVNYMREYQIAHGADKASAYQTVFHVMACLLVIGFIANFLVRPVDQKYWMTESKSPSLEGAMK